MKTTGNKKTYPHTSAAPLEDYLENKGITAADYAREIGVSPGCVTGWIRSGEMPIYIGLLVETQAADSMKEIRVVGSDSEIQTVITLIERFDVTITD